MCDFSFCLSASYNMTLDVMVRTTSYIIWILDSSVGREDQWTCSLVGIDTWVYLILFNLFLLESLDLEDFKEWLPKYFEALYPK